jgi:hypothetical protein
MNTPFYVNSIQQGVEKFRNYDEYPYTVPAYLFLNSLPLSTLREKYKTYNPSNLNNTVQNLDYIISTLKKFGAIHKVPYAWILKLGSIWHRYKTYIETDVDILDDCWTNFDQVTNFDPVTNNPERNYGLVINGANIDIVLEKDTVIGTETSTLINTGFYPKLINDFNVFYQGYQIYSGFTDTDIQNGFETGVTLNYVAEAIINEPEGFDNNNPMRDIRVIPWTVTVDNLIKTFTYPIPSQGSLLNQTFNECFIKEGNVDKLKIEVKGNRAMYDGSIRNFWASPHFGYFDLSKIKKPEYDEYIKFIYTDTETQQNFAFNNPQIGYNKISELFSAFDKDILDKFEQEFLKFSLPVYKYDVESLPENLSKTEKSFRNFHMLMREMMKVPKSQTTGSTGTEAVSKTQQMQTQQINSYIKQFLSFDYVFKYGNPSSFDKKLFYTFSNKEIVDGYTWEKYTETTPDALPTSGGTVNLLTSQTNYPEEWRTLRLYVGFSEIPELTYKNNGSFITDFFIDLNVGFNVLNIKNFAPIIKIYATQKLKQTQPQTSISPTPTPPVLPTTQFVGLIIQIFTLNDGDTITIYKINENKFAILRNIGQEIVFVGGQVPITDNPDNTPLVNEAITNVYGFTSQSPADPQYIAGITTPPTPQYPLVPSASNNWGQVSFINGMDEYLNTVDDFQGTVINNLMIRLRAKLPVITVENKSPIQQELDGSQTKLELWESFKATNDKWISGGDFKSKTIFEDLLLLDRASRNIGDKVLVDIFHLKEKLEKPNVKMSVLTFFQSILLRNNFMIMNIPSYVNFYNVQDAVKNAKPRPEGTTEFANTLFGTFLNVDYRQSSSKMVCFFVSKPSEHVDMKNNVDYRFKDDAFDLRRASDNPLVEDQIGKTDWDKSNKVVGFNVDIGTQNQSIFKSFNVGQEQGTSTAESLQIINDMANQSANRGGSSQNLSLYNIYKNRSYTCNVSMMGNALIQPTMYFNLRHVPMFNGPYMILSVDHNITPGHFETIIGGIRQPTASLPKIDQFVQTLRVNLLKSIQDKLKSEKTKDEGKTSNTTTNSISENQESTQELTTNPTSTSSANQVCTASTEYSTYVKSENVFKRNLNIVDMSEAVNEVLSTVSPNDTKLAHTIFAMMWLNGNGSSAGFTANNYNYAGIDLTSSWGQSGNAYFLKEYFCSSNNVPYVSFDSYFDIIEFLAKRWKSRMPSIKQDNYLEITKFIILNSKQEIKPESFYEDYEIVDLTNIETEVESAIRQYDQANRQLSL